MVFSILDGRISVVDLNACYKNDVCSVTVVPETLQFAVLVSALGAANSPGLDSTHTITQPAVISYYSPGLHSAHIVHLAYT